MKKVLLIFLAVVIVLGVIAAAGVTGYRFGYARGLQASTNEQTPERRPFDREGPRGMFLRESGMYRGFHRGFGAGGFPMRGFGFFSPLRFLMQIAVLALLVWFAYWLFTRSGWRFIRTTQTVETPPRPTEAETNEEQPKA